MSVGFPLKEVIIHNQEKECGVSPEAANAHPACVIGREAIDKTTHVARDDQLKHKVELTKKLSTASMTSCFGCYMLPLIIETGSYKEILHLAGLTLMGGAVLIRLYGNSYKSHTAK